MRSLFVLFTAAAVWAQDPIESRNALNQGVRAFQSAQYPEAIQSFQRAVELDPSSATARLYLATAYFQQIIPGAESPENTRNIASAQDGFMKVLALDPQNKVAISSLASLNLYQKRWDDARGWYERLISVDPNNADAYYSLGFIAWSEWYPAYMEGLRKVGMTADTPGPIPDLVVKQDLNARFSSVLQSGLANLRRTLELNPQYEDAMSYMNLLIRERAALRDSPEEYRTDISEADQWLQKTIETKKLKAQPARLAASDRFGGIRIGPAILEQKLIHRVNPVYPPFAAQARIQGIVRLNLVISKEGSVNNAFVISGHPLLVPAAVDAVKQWLYQPTLLNGNPVEVMTEVTVPFNLDPSVIVK